MKKLSIEVVASVLFVGISTFFIYNNLSGITSFWDSQSVWSALLFIGWIIISSGYYHQGFKIRKAGDAREISVYLPIAVFIVQCVLFVKGVHYRDWALTLGALVVNSGVAFCLYQIYRTKHRGC